MLRIWSLGRVHSSTQDFHDGTQGMHCIYVRPMRHGCTARESLAAATRPGCNGLEFRVLG